MRGFVDGAARLTTPNWPIPTPDQDFIRYFGAVRTRKRGGLANWVGENYICDARRAFSFKTNLSFAGGEHKRRIPLRCAFRRFYSDGLAVGKFEAGIATKRVSWLKLDKRETRALIDHLLTQPVATRAADGLKTVTELGRLGKALASSYLHASTTLPLPAAALPDWWVSAGRPLLFLELTEREELDFPYYMKKVETILNPDFATVFDRGLYHCLIPYQGQNISTWILHLSGYADDGAARRLRLYLLRLHAEYECLRLVLKHVMNKKIDVPPHSALSDNLQDYFNKAVARIGRAETASKAYVEDEVIDIARASIEFAAPGEREALLETLERFDMRKNIYRKVREVVEQMPSGTTVQYFERVDTMSGDTYNIDNTGGIFNLRSKLDNVTQTVNNLSNADDTTKQQLAALVKQLSAELEKVPEAQKEDAEVVADLTKDLVEAANQPQPKKKLLEIKGDSLKKAAENILGVMPIVLKIAGMVVGLGV